MRTFPTDEVVITVALHGEIAQETSASINETCPTSSRNKLPLKSHTFALLLDIERINSPFGAIMHFLTYSRMRKEPIKFIY
jgi:hypothetical protein